MKKKNEITYRISFKIPVILASSIHLKSVPEKKKEKKMLKKKNVKKNSKKYCYN